MSELGEDIRRVVLDDQMMWRSTADNAEQVQGARSRLRMFQEYAVPISSMNGRIVCAET